MTFYGTGLPLYMEDEEEDALARRGFSVGKAIAGGSYGTIYRGTHYSTPIAVKKIDMLYTDIPDVRNEMLILKRFQHKYIVKVLDYYLIRSRHLLIFMELLQGGDLGELIQSESLMEAKAAQFYGQFGDALRYLHEHGFAHRDLKPGNILLNEAKTMTKLADFGLSSCGYDTVTGKPIQLSTYAGTPEYMAPEVILCVAHHLDRDTTYYLKPRPFCPFLADIWSLGIILYEILHGYHVFPHSTDALLVSRPIYKDYHQAIFNRALMCWIPFNFKCDRKVSQDAEFFIRRHLRFSPEARPDMEYLLADPWVSRRSTG